MDPQVFVQINPSKEGTHDSIVDLDGNVYETQIELGLISELKILVKIILGIISQSTIDLVKNYSLEPSFVFLELIH